MNKVVWFFLMLWLTLLNIYVILFGDYWWMTWVALIVCGTSFLIRFIEVCFYIPKSFLFGLTKFPVDFLSVGD